MGDYFYPHGFLPPDVPEYNCSSKTNPEWLATGERSPVYACYLMVSGVTAILLYIFVIAAMSNSQFLSLSSYKLMYLCAWIDIGNQATSVITGYLCFLGTVYCSHPEITWFAGMLAIGCFMGTCVNCTVLALDRMSTMTGYATWMFGAKRVYHWFAFILFVVVYIGFFTRPPLFNTAFGTYIYAPMIRPMQEEILVVGNPIHVFLNLSIPGIISLAYIVLCGFLINEQRQTNGVTFDKKQWRLFVQVAIICGSLTVTLLTYVYMLYFEVPIWFYKFSNIGYQWCSFTPCLICFTLNRDVRSRIRSLLGRPGRVNVSSGSGVTGQP